MNAIYTLVKEKVIEKMDSYHVHLLDEYLPGEIDKTVKKEVDIAVEKKMPVEEIVQLITQILVIEGERLEDEDYEHGEGDDH